MTTTQHAPLGRWWPTLRLGLVLAGVITLLLALVRWGGTARSGPILVAGVAALTALLMSFGAALWWLFLSPLPERVVVRPRSAASRQAVAVLIVCSAVVDVIGAFWDDLWHKRYGGFGDDFLWPPHLLLYGGIGLLAGFALAGVVATARGRGGLRARFRSDPLLSLIGLTAAFMIVSIPSDLVWHKVYGVDITAWSLPHLVMTVEIGLVWLAGVSVQLSLVPAGGWQRLRGLRWAESLALALIALVMTVLLQVGTTEWEGAAAITSRTSGDVFRSAFWQRPTWLYPVILATVAAFSGNVALHATRRAGSASIVAALVLALRLAALAATGGAAAAVGLGYTSQLLPLAAALALDGWYALRLRRADTVATLVGGNLVAGLALLLVGLPYIDQRVAYPPVTAANLPSMVACSLIMALAAGWAGARLGGWLGHFGRDDAAPAPAGRALGVALLVVALTLVAVLGFMLAARPPQL